MSYLDLKPGDVICLPEAPNPKACKVHYTVRKADDRGATLSGQLPTDQTYFVSNTQLKIFGTTVITRAVTEDNNNGWAVSYHSNDQVAGGDWGDATHQPPGLDKEKDKPKPEPAAPGPPEPVELPLWSGLEEAHCPMCLGHPVGALWLDQLNGALRRLCHTCSYSWRELNARDSADKVAEEVAACEECNPTDAESDEPEDDSTPSPHVPTPEATVRNALTIAGGDADAIVQFLREDGWLNA